MIRIWDLAVRTFHWALVGLVTTSLISVNLGGNAMIWHVRAGVAILTLLLFRWVWGAIGSTPARFGTFLQGPAAILAYVRVLLRGEEQPPAGHNPLGGWMVLVMLLALTAQALTGLFSNDDIFTEGPLAHLVSKSLSDTFTSFHSTIAEVILALIALHVVAVLFHLIVRREGLLRPMFTGRIAWPADRPRPDFRFPSPWLAPGILLLVIAAVAAVLWLFAL